MAQLLNFTDNDLLGSVTHVDTEQIVVEIENTVIMGQICVGNLVAIETGKRHEFLISLIDKVTRKYIDDFDDTESEENEIMVSSADYVKVSIIGTYHSVLGDLHDVFKRGVDTFPQIETRFVKGVFSKQSHSSPWKQHITGFPRGIFRKFHNLYLSANPSIYGYVISLPFIFAYSAKLLRAFAKPTISDSFNVQITDSHSLIHFFVCFICSSEI